MRRVGVVLMVCFVLAGASLLPARPSWAEASVHPASVRRTLLGAFVLFQSSESLMWLLALSIIFCEVVAIYGVVSLSMEPPILLAKAVT